MFSKWGGSIWARVRCLGAAITPPSVWPSYGLPGSAVACRTNTPPGGAGIGGGDRGFNAELVRRAGFTLADALDLGGMEGIKLPTALALLLRAICLARVSGHRNSA